MQAANVPVGASLAQRATQTLEKPSNPCTDLEGTMGIIWTIIIGFLAGLIARWIHPGVSNEPSGFILTTVLGIVGAFVATFLGQAVGWYHAGEGAGLIGAIVGAVIVLVIWGFFANRTKGA
jgi:uncharacterized membrane protein YeaQ/YmgE (transglycosylase-associated protein family)